MSSFQENQAICAILTSMPRVQSYCNCRQCSPSNSSDCSLCSSCFLCDAGNITTVDLSLKHINGTIPTQIGQLVSLTNLLLVGTIQISGTIPTQIGHLTSLAQLDLSRTQISGTIPTQIGQLVSLTFFDLSRTQINGTIPTQIGLLTSLTYIHLAITHISGTIPTQIGHLVSLISLDFDSTQISGTLPTQIGQLVSLTRLDLSISKISGTIPTQIGHLTSLTHLYLDLTQINGTIPTQIGHIVSLTNLDFATTQISGTIPTQIGQLVSLSWLDLSSTQISGTIPTQIGLLIHLTFLDTSNTKLSGGLLNRTNILHSTLDLPSLSVNGNMLMSDSSINLENNLYIQEGAVLTLQSSTIFVSGDLHINPQSTIVLTNSNFTINIKHCAFLDGSLIININQSLAGKSFPILTSQCINGTFSSVIANFTDTPQCDVTPNLEYVQDVLSVSFDIGNHCNSEAQTWIYIVIGIAGILSLFAIIGAAILISRKFEERKKTLDKFNVVLPTTTL